MFGTLVITVAGQPRRYAVRAGRATLTGTPEVMRPTPAGAWAWQRVPRSQVERITWAA
jgi:hypothetical protein